MVSLTIKLNQISKRSIAAAGPRYSPGIEIGAPNLVIASLSSAIEALGQSPSYKQTLSHFETSIRRAWRDAPEHIRKLFHRLGGTPTALADVIAALQREEAGKSTRTLGKFSRLATTVAQILSREDERLWKILSDNPRESKEAEATRMRQHQLRRLRDAISALHPLLAEAASFSV
jgi:hypothetical protein